MRFLLSLLIFVFLVETAFARVCVENLVLAGKGVQENAGIFSVLKHKAEVLTGLSSDRMVIFKFFDTTAEFVRFTGMNWRIAAIYVKGGNAYFQPIEVLWRKKILKNVFAHEYVHFLLDVSGYRFPIWVNEAVAIYYESVIAGKRRSVFSDFYTQKKVIDALSRMHGRMKPFSAYVLLGDFGAFLLGRYGLAGLRRRSKEWFEKEFKKF